MSDVYHYDEETGEAFTLFGSVPIDDTQASEDTVYSSAKVETMMDEVQWKLLDEKTGNSSFTLPNDWHELCATSLVPGNTGAASFHIVRLALPQDNTTHRYFTGYYISANNYCTASYNVSNTAFSLVAYNIAGSDVISTAKTRVVYR